MAWNPKYAFADLMQGIRRALTFEEIAQGAVNSNQDAVRVERVGVDALVDGSGTIAAGGVSQQIFAANPDRKYLFVVNISDTAMWLNFGTAANADQPSIYLAPLTGYYEPLVVSRQMVNIFCATTGKKFVAKQA